MKILPTKIHGTLDYVVGVLLILAPSLFGFYDQGGPAVLIPQLLGASLIIYSLLTDYEWGVYRVLPMTYHLVFDFLAAVFLAASPWIFSFSDEDSTVWVPHVVVGVLVIIVVLISQNKPDDSVN